MKFGTKAIHAGVEPDPTTGAIMTPVYMTSTYVQTAPGEHKGYEYSRTHNPTRDALQNALAELENGKFGLCFSSGMAAMDAVVKLLKPGDEVLSVNDLYGGSYRLLTKVYQSFGIKSKFIDMSDASGIEQHITDNTKLLWLETPTNPLMNIVDIEAIAAIGKKHGLITVVDNTFATPYLQNPLNLGADIVAHSITKYLGGHSDVVMGCLVTSDPDLHEQLAFVQNSCGAVPGPMDSFLVLRGLKTLHIRMQRHGENGMKIAHFLQDHDKVDQVWYPGLESHPNYAIAQKQMRGNSGMMSFTLKGDNTADALKVLRSTRLFTLAESLGGVESLLGHPASMTHASIPKEERQKAGLKDSLIRLSVGLEDIDDLIEDLRQAINTIS